MEVKKKLHFTQMKETNFFIHEIFQIMPYTSTSLECLFVFLSLSNIVLFKHVSQKYP